MASTTPLPRAETRPAAPPSRSKRLLVCCDGTWMNALGKDGGVPPSNVTRLARVVRSTCVDGTHQIIMYHPGVGSSGTMLNSFIGGTFGSGLGEDIRELYNFICSNFSDGDDIILVGFSRGAFTARSVADLIASVGLLSIAGFEHFYQIFEDYENMGDKNRSLNEFLWHGLAPYKGEKGKALIRWENDRKTEYRNWLKQMGYTRDTFQDGVTEIRVKAVCVFETVGSLGIPPAPVLGLQGWKFSSTQISDKVENAFQALALDEPRGSFKPSLWERLPGTRTNLKQVWFPGSHATIGGGWFDQQIANITLAWMCDQLSTLGVEFDYKRVTDTFYEVLRYNAAHPFPYVPSWKPTAFQPPPLPWSLPNLFRALEGAMSRDPHDCSGKDQHPLGRPEALWSTARPWGLGQMRYPTNVVQLAAGTIKRHPGMFVRIDPETNKPTREPLLNTNERVHSCVRIRLAAGGLGMDDMRPWQCAPLQRDHLGRPLWRLERGSGFSGDAAPSEWNYRPRELDLPKDEYPDEKLYPVREGDGQFNWAFAGQNQPVPTNSDETVPMVTVLPEEPMIGYWERLLLGMTAGQPDVWRYAEEHPAI